MSTNVRPVMRTEPARSGWRRAFHVAIVVTLVVASVAAQAVNLTPVAIVLLIAAICALAPLFTPALDI
jgi:type IV secretory pathway VirB6-like protein